MSIRPTMRRARVVGRHEKKPTRTDIAEPHWPGRSGERPGDVMMPIALHHPGCRNYVVAGMRGEPAARCALLILEGLAGRAVANNATERATSQQIHVVARL